VQQECRLRPLSKPTQMGEAPSAFPNLVKVKTKKHRASFNLREKPDEYPNTCIKSKLGSKNTEKKKKGVIKKTGFPGKEELRGPKEPGLENSKTTM